jgi:Domain of unknown function (DUF4291)
MDMNLTTELYIDQVGRWPSGGKHILAHYDAETIVVYQAYRRSIARYAIEHGMFGGDFSYSRMSWIKPNFLWMMYRSGWANKEGQEFVLGLRLRRQFFDSLLERAVASSLEQSNHLTSDEWKAAVINSEVRLQWDPDHDPHGRPVSRRAIQLGLRGATLDAFGKRELIEVINLTDFVAMQRSNLARAGLALLKTPVELIYIPTEASTVRHLKLD